MQASEAFTGVVEALTGVVVGAGPSGLLAALPPDNTLASQYDRRSPRSLLRAA